MMRRFFHTHSQRPAQQTLWATSHGLCGGETGASINGGKYDLVVRLLDAIRSGLNPEPKRLSGMCRPTPART
jgi:hypothetical protein